CSSRRSDPAIISMCNICFGPRTETQRRPQDVCRGGRFSTRLGHALMKIQTYSYFAWRKCFIPASTYVKCGTQTRTKYVSISSLVGAVGGKLCKCLIGMHGFTGCDNVSAFAGRGEITALRLVKQQKSYEEFFKQLGMEWVLSNELFQSLQEFTCKLYCSQPGTDNINEMRSCQLPTYCCLENGLKCTDVWKLLDYGNRCEDSIEEVVSDDSDKDEEI
ncbi:unnamed protein product, partial [Pocillopora meandrina]